MDGVFERLGLNEREFRIYSVLNEFGEMTSSELVKRTKIPSSKIYFLLDFLIKKGLVSYYIEKSKKVFRAQHPNRFYDIVEKQKDVIKEVEDKLAGLLPDIIAKRGVSKDFLSIDVFEGVKGIMSFHDKILKIADPGETVLLVGSSNIKSVTLKSYFRHFHEKRVKKKIKYGVLKNKLGKDKPFLENLKYTKVRYMPVGLETPTTYCIFRSSVAIIIYNVQPTLIRIKNAELAKSFTTYFNAMWRVSTVI